MGQVIVQATVPATGAATGVATGVPRWAFTSADRPIGGRGAFPYYAPGAYAVTLAGRDRTGADLLHAGSGAGGSATPTGQLLVLLHGSGRLLPVRAIVLEGLDSGRAPTGSAAGRLIQRAHDMHRRTLLVPVAALLVLAGCATVPSGPSVMVLPGTQKSFPSFQNDQARLPAVRAGVDRRHRRRGRRGQCRGRQRGRRRGARRRGRSDPWIGDRQCRGRCGMGCRHGLAVRQRRRAPTPPT